MGRGRLVTLVGTEARVAAASALSFAAALLLGLAPRFRGRDAVVWALLAAGLFFAFAAPVWEWA